MNTIPIPFAGASATGRSVVFDADRAVNFFTEQALGSGAETPLALLGTAGLQTFCTMPETPIRAMHTISGRLMVVAGGGLYEVYANGTGVHWASLQTTVGPVGITDNNGQLVIGDGTGFFVFDFAVGLTQNTDAPLGTWSAYMDGYSIFLQRDDRQAFYSSPDNAGAVDGLDFFVAEGDPDTAVQIATTQTEVWVFKQRTTEIFYDSGNTDNVFQRIGAGRLEQGCSAPQSVRRFDNSLVWLGADQFGQGIVWKAVGYTPQRISSYAVEYDIGREPDLSKITALTWQDAGHSFYQLNLPAAGTSWVYDAATSQWHERAWWNTTTGMFERHRADIHVPIFGQHLVADYAKGNIYVQSLGIYSDDGNPLRALRRVGFPNQGLKRIAFKSIQVDMETGVAG